MIRETIRSVSSARPRPWPETPPLLARTDPFFQACPSCGRRLAALDAGWLHFCLECSTRSRIGEWDELGTGD